MLYIFGDSHAMFSFKNLNIPHENRYMPSVTMFRIGRDNQILNFDPSFDSDLNTIVICYGEVDCRCHIGKQVNLNRAEDDVILELVERYFETITNNIKNAKVVVVGVIPPTEKNDCERIHGTITHEYPFVNSDEDRVRYTSKVNALLEEKAVKNNFAYFNPYSYYTRNNGNLKHELSDNNVHIGDNSHILTEFSKMLLTQRPFAEQCASPPVPASTA
jgi:ribosomal protein S17E